MNNGEWWERHTVGVAKICWVIKKRRGLLIEHVQVVNRERERDWLTKREDGGLLRKRRRGKGAYVMEAYSRRALSSKASTLITHVFASKVGPKCLEANGNVSQQHWAFTYLSTNNILPTNAHFFSFLSFYLFFLPTFALFIDWFKLGKHLKNV